MPLIPDTFRATNPAAIFGSLAARAAVLFGEPEGATLDSSALQNVYRLLEIYRYDAFSNITPSGVLQTRDPPQQQAMANAEGIKAAMDAARQEAFPETPKDAAITELQSVVRALATKTAAQPEAMAKTRTFFEMLAQNLRPALHS